MELGYLNHMGFSKESLVDFGFKGFVDIAKLKTTSCNTIPQEKGVYVILRESTGKPVFLKESIGGHFKEQNPTVSEEELKNNWVENTIVVYIGKAGGTNSNATLFSRLRQYIHFGQGKPVGHWGGRYIWQLKDSDNLIIAWKPLNKEEPEEVETQLMQEFRNIYRKRPFANLTK
jgi:hypothetical protein